MSKKLVKQRLLRAIKEAGTQVKFAEKHGITQPYVSDLVRGRREVPEKMFEILGLKIDYVEID